jgi:diacylglycerol kinase family enzyme
MTSPAVVLLNPYAGGVRARALRVPIQRWLLRHAPGVPLLAPDNADAARATLMVVAPQTRVVLVGGDGTVHDMLPALLRCGHRVGLVPAGRANELSSVLGLAGLGWEEALRYALHAPTQAIDVGQLDADQVAHLFITRLAAGHDALYVHHHIRAPAWLGSGAWASRWASVRASLRNHPFDLRLWINGRLQHDASALGVVISNTPDGRHRVNASLVDATFETRVRASSGRMALLWARSRPVGLPDSSNDLNLPLQWSGATKILVDAARPLPLTADGEALPRASRFSVRCLPRALHVAGRVDVSGG